MVREKCGKAYLLTEKQKHSSLRIAAINKLFFPFELITVLELTLTSTNFYCGSRLRSLKNNKFWEDVGLLFAVYIVCRTSPW